LIELAQIPEKVRSRLAKVLSFAQVVNCREFFFGFDRMPCQQTDALIFLRRK